MAEPLEKTTTLYERDFYAWTQDQAQKLRARAGFDNRDDVDWDHAAEEIEGVGASEKREIRSRLKTLLVHLLKWRFQPGERNGAWESTIGEQRERIAMVIEDSPSLRSFPGEALPSAHVLARRKAIEETELPENAFPLACPFSIDQILDETFYPETD